MWSRSLVALSLASLAAACAPAVTVNRDATLPIHAGATFAWGVADGPRTAAERDPRFVSDSVRDRLERAIEDALASKGFRKVPYADAEFIVHYHVGMSRVIDTLHVTSPCGPKPCADPQMDWGYWGPPEESQRQVAYTQGSLMVDILARPSMKVAWRGTIVGEVRAGSSSEARIRKGVVRLLSRFPEQ